MNGWIGGAGGRKERDRLTYSLDEGWANGLIIPRRLCLRFFFFSWRRMRRMDGWADVRKNKATYG